MYCQIEVLSPSHCVKSYIAFRSSAKLTYTLIQAIEVHHESNCKDQLRRQLRAVWGWLRDPGTRQPHLQWKAAIKEGARLFDQNKRKKKKETEKREKEPAFTCWLPLPKIPYSVSWGSDFTSIWGDANRNRSFPPTDPGIEEYAKRTTRSVSSYTPHSDMLVKDTKQSWKMALDSRTGLGKSQTGPTEKLPEIVHRTGISDAVTSAALALDNNTLLAIASENHGMSFNLSMHGFH